MGLARRIRRARDAAASAQTPRWRWSTAPGHAPRSIEEWTRPASPKPSQDERTPIHDGFSKGYGPNPRCRQRGKACSASVVHQNQGGGSEINAYRPEIERSMCTVLMVRNSSSGVSTMKTRLTGSPPLPELRGAQPQTQRNEQDDRNQEVKTGEFMAMVRQAEEMARTGSIRPKHYF